MSQLVRFDWAIKYLLRNKANFDILEGFLSELLKTSIKIEQVLESEGNKNHAIDKYNRVDLLVKTASGDHIIIEVQCSNQWDYLSRILYGTSKVVCEYLHAGDAYQNIRKVISVSIVFFNLGEGKDYLYKGTTVFKGLHYHDTLNLNAQERKVYGQADLPDPQTPERVFPEYYIIKVAQFHQQVQDKFDEWIYFFKYGKVEENFAAQGLQSAATKLDVLRLNPEQRRAYEHFREGLHDEASWALMVNIQLTEAHDKGLAEGFTKARAEGQEQMKKLQIQIARSLKQKGFSDAEIAADTQLSLEEIQNID